MLPIAYAKGETKFTSNGLAILDTARDVTITERLNAEYNLSLKVAYDSKMRENLDSIGYIKVDDTVFSIMRTTLEKDSRELDITVECEHIRYELLGAFVKFKSYERKTLNYILNDLLSGTRFKTYSWQDNITEFDFDFELKNVYECLVEIANAIGGEIDNDNLPDTADDKLRIGIRLPIYDSNGIYVSGGKGQLRPGVEIRPGKNIKALKKELDRSDYFNKVFYYGKDAINFAGATISVQADGVTPLVPPINLPATQDFLYVDPSPDVQRVSYKEFSEISNITELYYAALSHFRGVSRPKVNYDIEVVDIRSLPEFLGFDEFGVGDFITFLDDDLVGPTLKSTVRVTEYTRYPYEQEKNRAKFETVQRNIFYTFAEFGKATKSIQAVTTSNNQLNPEKLDNMYVLNKAAVPSGIEGHFIFNGYYDGLYIGRTKSSPTAVSPNCLFLKDDGETWLLSGGGVGFIIDGPLPKIRLSNGFTYNVLSEVSSIDRLLDVDTTTNPPAVGQTLKWNGSRWVPSW